MLPSSWEYLFVLAVLSAATVSLFWATLTRLARHPPFLAALALFMLFCIAVDYIAIQAGWWAFPDGKVVGLRFLSIPLEEYLLFLLAFITTVACWEFEANDLD